MSGELLTWLAYFYSYCFLGWVWETIYVWIADRKPSNRGFLIGPVIPLYGFGACALLLIVSRLGNGVVTLFLLGFVGASLLELITGVVMERIFETKYWDYSHLPLNFKGYICLPISIGWGVFSTVLIRVVHPIVSGTVQMIEIDRLRLALIVSSILFVIDVIYSTLEAIDLRELLAKQLAYTKEKFRLENRLSYLTELRDRAVDGLKNAPGKAVGSIREMPSRASSGLRDIEEEITNLKQELSRITNSWQKEIGRKLRAGLRVLRRNPHTSSKRYSFGLEEIKKFLQRK
ncbi:MAG: putative ABC transporter permease [Lachnospiraceae bacterium]|nr:putative ABC transporter permease [Lachnospiraceae bacterium]MDY5742540.1 putative ABC transporter permease [Lachnospiraceae bacterium]